ncbi:MAG TPA: translation elongation factor Ts [Rhodanobacteraceae bacterium]|jgi:elongation factor Ts|nr:translation elongation factor Ts [Rhodanobacteraceae bacterium]
MDITAAMVKELRERSGAGMMECKKALTQNNGDIEVSIEWLRKQGLAKADKKADRVAAEGRIAMAHDEHSGVLVEVNCETDFVGKDENFLKFVDEVAKTALASGATDADSLKAAKTSHGPTVEEGRQWLVAKVGENVQVRRVVRTDNAPVLGAYVHGGRIGVLVALEGGDAELARGVAMHIAAMNPQYVTPENVPADFVAKEKEISLAQMSEKDKQKPAEIQEKMLAGKIRKTLNEISLTGQPFVLDTNVSVGDALARAKARVLSFHRIAVGEGIEKVVEDYAAEVMKQAGLA